MSARLPHDTSEDTLYLRTCLDTVVAKVPTQLLDAAVATSSRQEAVEVRVRVLSSPEFVWCIWMWNAMIRGSRKPARGCQLPHDCGRSM